MIRTVKPKNYSDTRYHFLFFLLVGAGHYSESESDVTYSQVWWPHTRNLFSAFNPSKFSLIAITTLLNKIKYC